MGTLPVPTTEPGMDALPVPTTEPGMGALPVPMTEPGMDTPQMVKKLKYNLALCYNKLF